MDTENLQGESLDNQILLTDENGEEVAFEFLDLVPYQGQEYAVLLPAADADDESVCEVVILLVEGNPENPDLTSFVSVQDVELLNAVYDVFKERNRDVFQFEF